MTQVVNHDVSLDVIARYRALYSIPESVALTGAMVQTHWDLERDWARRLKASPSMGRAAVFQAAYTELYARLPWLKSGEVEVTAEERAAKYSFLKTLLPAPPATVLEVGSGGGALIAYLSTLGYRCIASDVTEERCDLLIRECPTLRWIRADAVEFARQVEAGSLDVVISDQVIEHLHPDDVTDHLRAAYQVLRPGGRYVVRLPHRLAGPGDVSQVFRTATAEGMHLKEYTYGEMTRLARGAGFEVRGAFFIWPNRLRQWSPVFATTWQGKGLLAYYRLVEGLVDWLPWRSLARRMFIGSVWAKNVCLVLLKPAVARA
jgi:SAM-dependent methyltransferase